MDILQALPTDLHIRNLAIERLMTIKYQSGLGIIDKGRLRNTEAINIINTLYDTFNISDKLIMLYIDIATTKGSRIRFAHPKYQDWLEDNPDSIQAQEQKHINTM